MSVIYPPYIEGKISTQYGDELRIPFQLNRALGLNEVRYVRARIKSIVNNSVIGSILTTTDFKTQISNGVYEARFSLMTGDGQQQINMLQAISDATKWQYYKIQLSFSNDSDNISSASIVWSTVGVFKYSTQPSVTIMGLDEKQTSYNTIGYVGEYNSTDTSEKVYRYKFDLYCEGALEETSQWQLHNAAKDESANRSTDNYTISLDLQDDKYYQLFYTVETNNGLIVSSPGYYIKKQIYHTIDYNFNFNVTSNPENGTIDLKIVKKGTENIISGHYKIMRKESSSNSWEEIDDLILDTQLQNDELLLDSDYTVKQGVEYEYVIMRYSGNLYQEPMPASPEKIICNFEDAFLYDGERQLRIRFNPKVTSFKNTILESKMDTIGGVYPFVFRNGRTKYKEFPISGLVSLLMDETGCFLLNEENANVESGRQQTNAIGENNFNFSTSLTPDNIKNEREFKIKVLDWLTNGEPKLFRSPTEGNYIVRLMNTSLSPNDTLGRMLHTFSSTAYEIAELSYTNLVSYDFTKKSISKADISHSKIINLDDYQTKTTIVLHNATKIQISESTPGAIFSFTYASGYNTNIVIGNTGNYALDTDNSDPIVAFEFDPIYRGKIEIELENQQDYRFVDSEEDENGNIWYLEAIKEVERVRQITNGKINGVLSGDEEILSRKANEYIIAKLKNIKYIKIRSKDLVFEGPELPTCAAIDSTNGAIINQTEQSFMCRVNGIPYDFEPGLVIVSDKENVHTSRDIKAPIEIVGPINEMSIGDGLIADIYYTEQQKVYKILTD